MLKLTEEQGAAIRQIVAELKEEEFKNVTIKQHPTFDRLGSKQEPLSWQFWPHLRVSITFDVPSANTPEGKPAPPPASPDKET